MKATIEHQAFRHFPEYEPLTRFEAALPLFHLPIVTKIVEFQDLSVISFYFLRAISLGVDTPAAMSELLGLSESDLAVPGAEVLRASLVRYGHADASGTRRLHLTEQGLDVLRERKRQPIPRQRTIHLHFSPITRHLSSLENDILSIADLRREGLFVVPHDGSHPSLAELDLAEIRAAHIEESQVTKYDIIGLTDIKTTWVEYLRVDVLLLRHQQSLDTRVAIFQRLRYLPETSNAVQRLQQAGVTVVPADALETLTPDKLILDDLPLEVSKPIELAISRERELSSLNQEVRRNEALRSATQIEQERQDLEAQIVRLKSQVDLATTQRDTALNEATANSEHPVEFISTLQHCPLLEQALDSAISEVIILSPWMNRRTVDQPLANRIRKALRRGVKIWIGYGYKGHSPSEDDRSRSNAQRVIRFLREQTFDIRTGQMEIVDLGAIHEKILICDRLFGAVGSFNWLSYRGDDDDGIRAETTVVLRAQADVERLAEKKMRELISAMR